ncbi:hypothetical protein [Amycolatopsis keratiniphila]|uniref:Uncharacterized protein n=1 Tax=Amycolatopsis keratiniphila subsp. keratiniphila TaxID=227715 RepID=A0A1W2M225_9PSEU|nr:hypothetical protein [Amycolatopsis keratiniphila]ONF73958.1 hypothetical protein AVR91_0204305 [Amycolatopsis keratiniphila subsp. keratiniphila]
MTSIGTQRGPWIVCTSGLAAAGFYDLVRRPRCSTAPEHDLADVVDLGVRQLDAAAPFEPGQVTVIRGEPVRLVPVTWRWRWWIRWHLNSWPGPMLRVVPL